MVLGLSLDGYLWGNTLYQWIVLLVYVLIGIGGGKLFYWLSTRFIKVFTARTKTQLDDILIEHLEKPIIFMIFLAGVYYGFVGMTFAESTMNFLSQVFVVVVTISVCWTIINLIDSFIVNYLKPMTEKSSSDLDDQLLPILRKLVKIIIWILVIIMIIKDFGIDVSALLTGAGLGGLAFALAAQDMLSNMFGGIAILTDKPFKVGDRVKVAGNDGFIKEIGLRTTRMKTFDGTQIVIPNSDIANSVLENISKEKARRMNFTIGLEYGTPQKKIHEAEKILKDIVKKNKHTKDNCIVSFKEFADSSLNLQVIYWIKNLDEILAARHEINMAIKERFEKAKIDMAFPTRTVHIASQPKKKR